MQNEMCEAGRNLYVTSPAAATSHIPISPVQSAPATEFYKAGLGRPRIAAVICSLCAVLRPHLTTANHPTPAYQVRCRHDSAR